MSNTVIKVENLSKQYRLGQVGTGTLSHDLNRWWARVRGKEDPFLKIGEVNDRATKGESEFVWALKDIGFEVKQGEVLGIIGKNGAGKSTLLKILSKVTGPTTGSVKAKGRIASLLEVGTGFHPELTGRENIYLNGTILGMTKREVSRKLDEIVDFAGVARYLDTPVKRYSSGMTVRLGFAVAAHLEPEILIVDEVLAVGDAEFQKKAVGKMKYVSNQEGRTVLFVSHNMASIQNLCTRSMVLVDGNMNYCGEVEDGINFYLKSNKQKSNILLVNRTDRKNKGNFHFTGITIKNRDDEPTDALFSGGKYTFEITFSLNTILTNPSFRLMFIDQKGVTRILCNSGLINKNPIRINETEEGRLSFIFNKFPLPKGNYSVQLSCFHQNSVEDDIEYVCSFDVEGGDFYGSGREAHVKDGVLVDYDFNISQPILK